MKKRVFSLLLCLTLLFSLFALPTSATSQPVPAGSDENSGVKELESANDTPLANALIRNLTDELTSSSAYYKDGAWTDGSSVLTEENALADVGNTAYGFSVIGVKTLARSAGAAVDGVWASGGGAFSAVPSGDRYDVNGNTGEDDSIYLMMFTFYFGNEYVLDRIGYAEYTSSAVGYPTAADIYVSDDGETWELVGYYDRPSRRSAGNDEYLSQSSASLGTDKNGETSTKRFNQFKLPKGTTGKYLRIAATALEGSTPSGTTSTTYTDWIKSGENHSSAQIDVREFFVFGGDKLSQTAGSQTGSGVNGLTAFTDTLSSKLSENLALGLTASVECSTKYSTEWYNGNCNLTAEQLQDIGNTDYGFSVIGAKALERSVGAAVDGVWAIGDGAFSAMPSGSLYNVDGEVGQEDSIYLMMFTFNFGYECQLDAIGYAMSTTSAVGYPTAADLYVSDDGETWRLIGYYDRPLRRSSGEAEYASQQAKGLGTDANGASYTGNQRFIQFQFPEDTTGKYLRVAATALEGKADGDVSDISSYDAWAELATTQIAVREFFVFGEAENVNYIGHQTRTYTDTKDTDTTEDDVSYYDVRFSANVDDYTLYDAIGYHVEAAFEKGVYAETGKTYSKSCKYVYTSLLAEDEGGNEITVSASEYHAGQLASLTIEGIPVDTGIVTFTVTPYYIITDADTGESKTVYAASYEVTFNAGVHQSTAPVKSLTES